MNHRTPKMEILMLRSLILLVAMLLTLGTACAQDAPRLIQRQTFIPVEDLDVVIARDQAGVLLSKVEFQQLYDAAKKNADSQPNLPAVVTATGAEYRAKIDGDHLVISATVRLQQFASGWVELPLHFGNLSVLSATVNDQPAKLGRRVVAQPLPNVPQPQSAAQNNAPQQAVQSKGKAVLPVPPQLVLFNNQAGAATLKLELSTILESVGADKSVRFELPDVPTAMLNVDVAANRTLKWFGRTLDRPTPADQPATYQLPVGGQKNVLLLFTGNQTQQTTDSLTFATTGYGVRVAPGEVVWEAQTRLQVFGTPLTTLQCVVPRSLEITDVTSTGLEAWTLEDNKDDPQSTLITLSYRQPIDASRDIVFKGVMSTPVGQSWAVPQIVIRKVTSHIGRCVVTHPAGVRLRLIEATGARAAASEQAATLTFDLWREAFRLVLETQPHQREVLATTATSVDLNARGVDVYLTVSLETLFAPLFEADIRLPAEWVVQSMTLDGKPIQWQAAANEAGWNDLRINLPQPVQPGSGIGLIINARRTMESWPVDVEPIEFKLPTFQLPQAATVEGTLTLKADDDLDVAFDALTGLDPAAAPTAGARSAFAYQDTAFEGTVKVLRRPSRMSAQTMTYARLDREVWNSHLEALIEISGGGLRELQVKLPESVGDDIRFEVVEGNVGISEQVAADPEDKARLWTLRLDRRYRGTLKIAVDAAQPRKDDKNFSVPAMTLPQAERLNGFVGIEGAADQQLTIDATDSSKKSLAEVDPIDLPLCHYQPQQRIVAGYRFLQPGYAVSLSEVRFEKLAVPTAICRSANYESVLSRTGELQHRAEYVFVAVTAQALTLTLPAGPEGEAELWAVQLDGQPVEVRRREGRLSVRESTGLRGAKADTVSYLIPLPRDRAVDAERRLTLFYRGQIDPLLTAQRWREQPPVLAVVQSEGAEQPLEILSQSWRVHYSNDSMITGSDGLFEPETELDSQSMLGTLRQAFTGMSPMSLFNSASYLFGATLLAVVITVLLRRHGVSKFGCAIAIAAVPVVLVALLLPSVQSARSYKGARYVASEAPMSAPMGGTRWRHGINDNADDGDGKIIEYVDICGKDDPSTGADEGDAMPPQVALGAMPPPATAEPTMEKAQKKELDAFQIETKGDGPRVSNAKPTDAPVAGDRLDDAKKEGAKPQEDAVWQALNDPQQVAAGVDMDAEPQKGVAQRERNKSRGRGPARLPATGKTGLLSLSLSLEVPANSTTKDFSYYGHQPVDSGMGLDLQWQDRKGGDAWRWCLVTGLAMAAWLTIKVAARWRGLLAVLGITLPLGLVAVTPPACHVVLDGLFLGSLLAACVWGGRALLVYEIDWCKRTFCKRAAQTAALFCAALMTASANAAETGTASQQKVESGSAMASGTQSALAPTGRQSIARGVSPGDNAALITVAPTGRDSVPGVEIELRPFGAFEPLTRGCAPGYRIRPLWGQYDAAIDAGIVDGAIVGTMLFGSMFMIGGAILVLLVVCRSIAKASVFETGLAPKRRKSLARGASPGDACLLVLAFSLAFASSANAQESPNAANIKAVPAVDASKTIVVPVDDAKDPTKAERVLLSRELFFELWNLAHPDKRIAAPASVDGFVASARYEVEVRAKTEKVGAAALVKAALVLQNFRDRQIVLSLPFDALALTSAKLDGQPAALQVREANGTKLLDVVLDQVGAHQLELEFAIAAQEDGATGQFTLPQFPAPSGTVVLKLPQPTLQVRVNGSTSAYRRLEQDGAAFVAIPVGNNQPLTVAWRPPQQQAAVNAIVNVDSTTGVLVDASGISHSTKMTIRVPQGTLADASFELPKGVLLQRIAGPHLSGWEMAGEADNRRVRVFFNPPISDATDLQFQLFQEQLVGDEPLGLTFSAVRPLEVTRESGLIGVLATEDFSIRSQQETGVRRVEVSNAAQFGDLLQKQPTATARLGFGFSTRPATAHVQVARQAAESVATTTHAVKVTRRKVLIASKFDLEFRRAARPSISLKLPEQYRPTDVQATSMADWFLTAGDGTNPRTLTIEFTQPLTGRAQVVMQGYQVKGPDDAIAEVLVPQPLEVVTQTTSAAVWFDAAYAATLAQADGWKLVATNVLPSQLLGKQSTPPQFGLTSTSLDLPPLGFDLVISQPRLAADSVVITTVTDTTVEYSLALKWKISNAAADTFWFTTPLWLKDRLTVKGAGLRDVKSEEVDGALRWTITLWDAVPSEYFSLAVATLPPASKRVETPEVHFLQPTLDADGNVGELGLLSTQRQFAMLVNQSQLQLRPTHVDDVETVTHEDIPIVINKELQQQAAEMLRIRDGSKLPAWDVKKLEQQAGAPASVNLADLSIVLAADGTWRGQAEYTIRNRRRQFLAVRMPEKSRLLSVFVSESPSRAVQTTIAINTGAASAVPSESRNDSASVQLIPLPKSNASDLSFKVKLVYSGELPSRLPRGVFPLSLDVDLPAPDVITQQESSEYGIPVAKTVWHVFVPKGIDAMLIDDGVRTNVTPTDRGEVEAYIASNMIRDGEQILSLFSGLSSLSESARRSQIRDNLKQQGLALNNVYQIEQQINAASGSGAQNAEFDAARRQFAEKLAQNRGNFAIVQQEQAANGHDLGFQQGGFGINNLQSGIGQQGQLGRRAVDENNDLVLNYNSVSNLKQLGLANSEDINRNGVLDVGEDVNGNGTLDVVLGAAPTTAATQVDGGLLFDLEVSDGDISKPTSATPTTKIDAEAKGKKAAEKNEALKAPTSNRSVQREQSLSRLKALNDNVELQQQVQPFDTNQLANPNPSNNFFNGVPPNAPMNGPMPGQGGANSQFGFGIGGGGAPSFQLPNSSTTQFGRGTNNSGYLQNQLGQQGQLGGGNFGGFAGGPGAGNLGGVPGKQQQLAQGQPGQPMPQRPADLQAQQVQIFDETVSLEVAQSQQLGQMGGIGGGIAAPRTWTAVGGLSLNIDLPGKENELLFSKVAGAPKLALKLRSRDVVQTGFGLAWLIVWSAVGLTFVVLFLRAGWRDDIGKPVAWLLLAVGMIVFVVLPQPLRAMGFLVFLAGLTMLGVRYVRRPQAV